MGDIIFTNGSEIITLINASKPDTADIYMKDRERPLERDRLNGGSNVYVWNDLQFAHLPHPRGIHTSLQ